MSDQDNLLGLASDVSSQGEDHFLDFSDPEEEPMEEGGATIRGFRLPSAYRGRDLHYRENPFKPLLKAVPTPPHLEDPGVPAKILGIEKVLQSLYISNRAKAVHFKEPNTEGQEKEPVDHSHPYCFVESHSNEDSRQPVVRRSH